MTDAATSKHLYFSDSTKSVRKLLSQSNIGSILILPAGCSPKFQQQNSFVWVGPALLFGLPLLTTNPQIVSISLNIISSFLYDFYKGSIKDVEAKLTITMEEDKGKTYKQVHYEGPASGIKDILDSLRN